MSNDKVSEKAIWEGSISPDNNTPTIAPQMQTQAQMMFCYKCNNVIPSNSKFCPCCNVVLFATCPKCGVKYSSQYLICNQCGTNREEYLRAQRREQERKEAIERENRRKQEILEKEKQEAERKQEEAYLRENAEIMKTKEYETTYSLMKEALETYNKKMILEIIVGAILTFAFVGVLIMIHALVNGSPKGLEKFLLKYVSKKNSYDKEMITYIIDDMKPIYSALYSLTLVKDLINYLPECCIIAYRKKHGLPIN